MNHYKWPIIEKFVTQAFSFVSNILIARILSPDDYGLLAMLAIFMSISVNFTESGFGDYLIKNSESDKKHFSTVFIFNVLTALFIYFILFLSASYISNFFGRVELEKIIKILPISLFFKAICLSEIARMRKELMFKNLAIINITTSIFVFLITYLSALNGLGYWSLVIQTISVGAINLLLIILINRWKPYFYFSLSRFNQMRLYSGNLLISYLTNQFGSNIYSLVIGKSFGATDLGFYRQGQKFNKSVLKTLNTIFINTSFPLLAKEKKEKKRIKMYIKLMEYFYSIQFTVSFYVIFSSYILIPFLLGEKWLQSVLFLNLILIAFIFNPAKNLSANILKIYNRTDVYRNLTFFNNVLQLIFVFFTYKYSIEVIIYGIIFCNYFFVLLHIFFSSKYINFSLAEHLKTIFNEMILPLISAILAYTSINIFDNLSLFLLVLIYSFVFIISITILNYIFRKSFFNEIISSLKIQLR